VDPHGLVFKALDDGTRRAILVRLRAGDLSAGEIAEGFPIGKASISHHLNLLKQAGLVPSTSEALRNIEQGGVKIDGATVSDKGLKVDAGEFVVQVGKRRFARVTLTA
jgi:DNA-binding transcriptional ArsR family regulator